MEELSNILWHAEFLASQESPQSLLKIFEVYVGLISEFLKLLNPTL